MLRITQNASPETATKYYNDLSHSDYYSQDSKVIGLWGGRGAAYLNLSGEVEKKDFHALCHNINPQDEKKQLTARNDENRTVGMDFTFDVPKSVSLVFSQTRDPDIQAALDTAIQFAMGEIEQMAETRVRKNAKAENRITGNLVFARFTHEETRPLHNGSPDPHLHQHVFVFNATRDSAENNKWKAVQFRNIKADAPYYEALFHNRLAFELERAGYALQRTPHNFEIAGFKRSTINKFSNRSLEINAKAEELGLNAEDKAKLGQRTRVTKRSGLDRNALQKEWMNRLDADELKLIREAKNKNRGNSETKSDAAKLAIEHSLSHGLERKSVIVHSELMIQALKYSLGAASKEELEAEIKSRKDLLSKEINKKKVYTSAQALQEEKQLIDAARAGRGQFKPVNPDFVPRNKELNEEQVAAVNHALQSRDFITCIVGAAGAGKTTTVKTIAEGVQSVGIGFHAFAPSSAASRDVQQQEGFVNGTTVAELLVNKKLQEQCNGSVLWIDEAGLVGCHTLNQVIAIAKKQNARLLLTGDTRQHSAIERGDGLKVLFRYGGVKPKFINSIQRQKTDAYKEAVKLLSEGQIEKGFRKLDNMDAIKESDCFDTAVNALAEEYVQARQSGESVLVVAPTHRQGQALTTSIREKLKRERIIGKKDTLIPVQINLAYTQAQKKDKASYESGQAVQFHQNVRNFGRGEICNIIGTDENGNVVVEHEGQRKILPLQEAQKFSIYRTEQIGLAKSDLIRITQNGYSKDKKRLNNGNTLTIKGFTENGDIIALTSGNNEVILDKNQRNLAHAYYSSSVASQGKSVNRVLILQTSQTGKAASKEQWYVSVSRGKFFVSIHTDNKARLLESVKRTSARMTATELISPAKEKSRVQSIRGKLRQMGEAARTKGTEMANTIKSYIPEKQVSTHERTR